MSSEKPPTLEDALHAIQHPIDTDGNEVVLSDEMKITMPEDYATWDAIATCGICDWRLPAAVFLTEEELEEKKEFLISLYQEQHDDDGFDNETSECYGEIAVAFTRIEE